MGSMRFQQYVLSCFVRWAALRYTVCGRHMYFELAWCNTRSANAMVPDSVSVESWSAECQLWAYWTGTCSWGKPGVKRIILVSLTRHWIHGHCMSPNFANIISAGPRWSAVLNFPNDIQISSKIVTHCLGHDDVREDCLKNGIKI